MDAQIAWFSSRKWSLSYRPLSPIVTVALVQALYFVGIFAEQHDPRLVEEHGNTGLGSNLIDL